MQIFDSSQRIAGMILLASLIPFIFIILLAIRGQVPSLYGLFRPIEDLANKLPLSGWALPMQLAYVILLLAGFGVLSVHLQDSGDRSIPTIAFGLFIGCIVLMAIEGTFYRSINPWAAREAVRTGSVPELYRALHNWMNTSVQMAYMIFGLMAFAGYGWSFLRTGIVSPWGAWATIGWSLAWLIYTLATQTTIPAGLFIWPWIVGLLLTLSK